MAAFKGEFPAKTARSERDEPTEHVARVVWMLVMLIGSGALEFARYRDRFGRSIRQFQRDASHLRKIGTSVGFAISPRTSGRILLQSNNGRRDWLGAASRDTTATLQRLATAFGGPIESEMRSRIGEGAADAKLGFLHARPPRPADGTHVARVYDFLKGAAESSARVEFAYTTARGARSTRTVEPYHVVERTGRYYLIGYDVTRRDWRNFALDAIAGPFRRAGSFTARAVPERLTADRAFGWIRGHTTLDVTIRVFPPAAAAVSARRWQAAQRISRRADGTVDFSVTVDDVDEAVRWALGFGASAIVVAPPSAVRRATEIVDELAGLYGAAPGRARMRLAEWSS